MSYFLWCPKADGKQHYACQDIDRWPTEEEQLRLITQDQHGKQPQACHFDLTDPTVNTPGTPTWQRATEHFQGTGMTQFPYRFGSGTNAYPAIQAAYRCSIHGTAPKIFMRYWPIHKRKATVIGATFTPHEYTLNNIPHDKKALLNPDFIAWVEARAAQNWFGFTIWTPIREIKTTHDVW